MISGNLKETLKALNKVTRKQTVLGRTIDFNRKILEHKKTGALLLSHIKGKPMLYQRDSGLNHILCKIARDNNITFIINLSELKKAKDKKEKAEILSRILQNLKLIKKYKNTLKIKGKNKYEASSLLLVLGFPTNMIKKAII